MERQMWLQQGSEGRFTGEEGVKGVKGEIRRETWIGTRTGRNRRGNKEKWGRDNRSERSDKRERSKWEEEERGGGKEKGRARESGESFGKGGGRLDGWGIVTDGKREWGGRKWNGIWLLGCVWGRVGAKVSRSPSKSEVFKVTDRLRS